MKLNTLLCAGAFLLSATVAHAVSITSYDITNANESGYGNWSHSYSGTITSTGTTGFPFGTSNDSLATYSGGSGTLNDGVQGTSVINTQLFALVDSAAITLFFDQAYTLDTILLSSFASGNSIPNNMTGFDASVGGVSASFSTTDVADNGEFVDFAGTALAGIATSSLVLSNFTSNSGYYAISEIQLTGESVGTPAVPVPAGLPLMLGGLMAFGALRRRTKG
jgi:hypothetical protein